jgi:hypothetical protein
VAKRRGGSTATTARSHASGPHAPTDSNIGDKEDASCDEDDENAMESDAVEEASKKHENENDRTPSNEIVALDRGCEPAGLGNYSVYVNEAGLAHALCLEQMKDVKKAGGPIFFVIQVR